MGRKKKQQKPWQFKFSFALVVVMLALITGYFLQSLLDIREAKPVRVAIEKVTGSGESDAPSSK
jgi:hypothetical protein